MISIIVAVSKNGVIGKDNIIPWRLRDDMRHFASITKGAFVIMGRKTYESILSRLGSPLPGRTNIVITRQKDIVFPGSIIAHSLEEAISLCPIEKESFVIGGETIYREALAFADRLYVTEVETECPGDAFFPEPDLKKFTLIESERHEKNEWNEYPFTFKKYNRSKAS